MHERQLPVVALLANRSFDADAHGVPRLRRTFPVVAGQLQR